MDRTAEMFEKLKSFYNDNFAWILIIAVVAVFVAEAVNPGSIAMMIGWALFAIFIGLPAVLLIAWLAGNR